MPRHPSLRRQLTWKSISYRQKRVREGSKNACVGFWKDLTSKRLMPIKVTFFFIMGATQCLAPFSTLFMISLGLKLEETAIIHAVGPLIPILAPFLAGIIADKIGNFKVFLVVSVAASGLIALINIAIPPARTERSDLTDNLKLDFKCAKPGVPTLSFIDDHCKELNASITLEKLPVTNCGYQCSNELMRAPKDAFIFVTMINSTYKYHCQIKKEEPPKCSVSDEDSIEVPLSKQLLLSTITMHPVSKASDFQGRRQMGLKKFAPPSARYSKKFLCHEDPVIELPKNYILDDEEYELPLLPDKLPRCHFHCDSEILKKKICNDVYEPIVHNVTLSVWLFILLKMLGFFMIGLTFTLFEAGVLAILKEHGHDYGLQRIYGSFGGMIFAPLTGLLIDYFGDGHHYSDYYLSFGLYCAIKMLCAVVLTKLDLQFKHPSKNLYGNLFLIISNVEAILLIIVVFISGMCYGFIEHFLPWYLKIELKAGNWLVGLTTTVSAISSIPCLAVAGTICRKFGHVQALSFGILCYAVRCIGYSLLMEPIWCLPLEVLEGITTGLLVASAITYGAEIADKENIGTMQGILATSHYGLGKSVGTLIGGNLMAQLSAVVTFRIFCSFAFLTAFSYYLAFKLFLLPRRLKKEKFKEEVSKMPILVLPLHESGPNSRLNICTSTPKKEDGKWLPYMKEDIENGSLEELSGYSYECERSNIEEELHADKTESEYLSDT